MEERNVLPISFEWIRYPRLHDLILKVALFKTTPCIQLSHTDTDRKDRPLPCMGSFSLPSYPSPLPPPPPRTCPLPHTTTHHFLLQMVKGWEGGQKNIVVAKTILWSDSESSCFRVCFFSLPITAVLTVKNQCKYVSSLPSVLSGTSVRTDCISRTVKDQRHLFLPVVSVTSVGT